MNTLLTKKELLKINRKNLKKGQILFRENDICKYVGIVERGEIVIKTIDESGKEIIYAKISKGSCFGNNLIFSNDKKYKGDVIALLDSSILLIDEKQMLTILKENSAFLLAYLKEQSNNIKDQNMRIKLLSIDSIEERFLFFLKENNNIIKYSSITSLAKEIGVQRETLSRLISKLVKSNVIIKDTNIIKRV